MAANVEMKDLTDSLKLNCQEKAPCCFLVLCGIPASGKSTLAKDLIKQDWKLAGKCVHFVYINYDDFIPENLPVNNLVHAGEWKETRRKVINHLEQQLLAKENVGLSSISQTFSGRSEFVSDWCSCGVNQFLNRLSDLLHVIVIDDNMFYRSMRYEYYQLARKASFGFAEIYLQCPVDVCLARNSQRATSVNEDTIIKMAHRIEKPEPEKFRWEMFSITVDTSSSQSAEYGKAIMKLLEHAVSVPAPPVKVSDDIQKAKDRAITEKSIVHQADQVIRKLISQKLEEMKARNHLSDVLQKEARYLNQRRKMVMQKIKKEPKQIVQQALSHTLNYVRSDENLTKSETAVNERMWKEAGVSSGDLESCNECSMDESLLESFWDIVTPEEFTVIIGRVFELT